jgi:hypothetical protein
MQLLPFVLFSRNLHGASLSPHATTPVDTGMVLSPPARTARRPSLGQLIDWLAQTETIVLDGMTQTREITKKQVAIRDRQMAMILQNHPNPQLPTAVQQRMDTLTTERMSWSNFADAHGEFLNRGVEALRHASRDSSSLFMERALIHVCTGIVYLKNVFVFTWSMRGKDRTQLLMRCRTCMAEGASHLDAIAPTLTSKQVNEHAMIYWTMRASAFHIVPQLIQRQQQSAADGSTPAIDVNQLSDPADMYGGELHRLAAIPAHLIDYRSLLEFIPFGLDPTLVASSNPHLKPTPHRNALDSKAVQAASRSAIQLARQQLDRWNHIRESPSDADILTRTNVTRMLQQSTPPSPSSSSSTTAAAPGRLNILRKFIQWPSNSSADSDYFHSSAAEDRRRKELHLAFLLQLASMWKRHSHEVRQLLLEANPRTLIPDLANIVAEYLDLDKDDGEADERSKAHTPTSVQMQ